MDLDFEAWLNYGQDKNWVSHVFCDTHEGAPLTEEEDLEWSEGGDPCSFHVKINEYN
jgi:hypothetical protein